MTAGSYVYIGPQGIVHGTTLTVLNAGRKYLKLDNLSGRVLLTSGLGGMSGAQAKAATICGCIGVVAEVGLFFLPSFLSSFVAVIDHNSNDSKRRNATDDFVRFSGELRSAQETLRPGLGAGDD